MVGLACLPKDSSTTFPDEEYTVSGWGRFSVFYKDTSDKLQSTTVKEVPINDCIEMYRGNEQLDPVKHMCAAKNKTDTCQGDSGGIRHFLLIFFLNVAPDLKRG